jgi:RNA polymerase sigma factor (sigma-70 family)
MTQLAVDDLDELLHAAAQGSTEAWNSIVDRFTGLLWAVARSYRLNTEDAGDVVQNTWLRLLDNVDRIQQPRALPKWLATTAGREALSMLRKRRRIESSNDDELFDVPSDREPSAEALLLRDEQDCLVREHLATLPERSQALLRHLMVSDPPSYADVAATFDMPVGSIGPTRLRALTQLRRFLTASGYPFDEASG